MKKKRNRRYGYRRFQFSGYIGPTIYYSFQRKWTTKELYSYELKTGRLISLTKDLPIPAADDEFRLEYYKRKFKIAAWVKEHTKMLLYDNYDIWLIDVAEVKMLL